jgi:hypothetical protein
VAPWMTMTPMLEEAVKNDKGALDKVCVERCNHMEIDFQVQLLKKKSFKNLSIYHQHIFLKR